MTTSEASEGKRRGRFGRWVLIAIAVLIGIPALVAAAVVIRLAYGPIEISIAAREIRNILTTLVGPEGNAEVATVSLGWQRGKSFVVVIDGMSLQSPLVTASFPEIVIDVDAEPLLLEGQVRAHSLVVDEPRMRITPPEDGGALALPEPIAVLDILDERLARLVAVAGQHGIDHFLIHDGAIEIDRKDRDTLALNNVDVRAGVGALGDASAAVTAESSSGTWSADMTRRADESGSVITLHVDGIGLATAFATDALSPDISLGATGEAQFSTTGAAIAATLSFTLTPGTMALGGIDDVELDRAELNLGWRPDSGGFTISPSPISVDGLDLVIAGTAQPPKGDDRLWHFQATVPRATLAPPDVQGPPVSADSATISGAFDPDALTFTFDSFSASAPTGAISGKGSLFIGAGGPRLRMTADLDAPLDYATFVRAWPRFVNAPARQWLVDNVRDGILTAGSIALDLGPRDFDPDPRTTEPGNDPADIRFTFERAVLKLPEELPPLEAAAGQGTILGQVLNVDIASGRLSPAGGAPVAVDPAKVVVPDLAARPLSPTISASASGPADSLAILADAKPADALQPLGISPKGITGTAAASITISGPMDAKIDPNVLAWKIEATLKDVGSAQPIVGRTIADANVTITADPQALVVSGTATVDGITAKVDLNQPLTAGATGTGGASFVLTDADRKAKGIDLGSMLTGPISVQVGQQANGRQTVTVDLEKATLRLAPLGWTKGAGVPAKASFDVRQDKDRSFHINNFDFTSDGVDLAGTIDLSASGQLIAADFRRFALRPGDQASATARRSAGGGYAITVNARRLDGRGILKRLKDGDGDGDTGDGGKGAKPTDVDVTAKIGTLVGFNGSSLDNVDLAFATGGGRISRLRLAARTQPGGRAVAAKLEPEGKQYRLTASAGDAGRITRFLDLYDRMEGGKAELDATVGGRTTSGNLVLRDFRVTEDPKLKQLVNVAKSAGDRSGTKAKTAAAAPDSAWSFTRMTVAFSMTGKTLTIDDAILRGTTSGGSASGTLDLGKGTMTLSGTYIPIYAVNNMFGRIPILGEILGAGRNGGLFGITFRLDGPVADPKLTFNPISTITPGILRRIFEFQ